MTADPTAESVERRVERVVREHFYPSPMAGSTERLAKALEEEFGITNLQAAKQECERLSKSPRITDEGFRDAEDLLDMGRVGRSLMERIEDVRRTPGYEHWMPADDPAEIVFDLINELADERARAETAEAKLAALEALGSLTHEVVREQFDVLDDHLGMLVRNVWVDWAMNQPNPKPHWLVRWDALPELDKEVDRLIGCHLFDYGVGITCRADIQRRYNALSAVPPSQGVEKLDMRKVVEALGFEPDNHHNALKCPYCTPEIAAPEPRSGDVVERLEAEAVALTTRGTCNVWDHGKAAGIREAIAALAASPVQGGAL